MLRRPTRSPSPRPRLIRWLAPTLAGVIVGLTLGLVLPATALPPQSCSSLTGDALTRCLYADVDARLTALEKDRPGPSPTSPPPTSPPPAAGSWLSGASGSAAANGSFGSWRGAPVEIIGTWIDDPAIYPFGPKIAGCGGCGEFAGWTGPADVGISPPTWGGWDRERNGGSDRFWTDTARKLAQYRAGKGTTYVRPYYEFNGDWFPHSVRRGEEAKFKQAWERVAAIFRREFPAAKMMLGTAASGHGSRIAVADAYPAGVDVLSIDFYNEWPFCTTRACFDDKIENGGGVNSLEDLRRLAASKGDPVLISEWGNANQSRPPGRGGGGEAPEFMNAWHDWLGRHAGTGAGRVLGEVYFNVEGYEARFEVYAAGSASRVAPQTANRYRQLFARS